MPGKFYYSALATVCGALANFIAIPILINHFGAGAFGYLAQFFVLVAMLPLFEFGVVQATIQRLSADKMRDTFVCVSFTSYIALFGCLIAIAGGGVAIISFANQLPPIFSLPTSRSESIGLFLFSILTVRLLLPLLTINDYVNENISRLTLISLTFNVLRTIGLAWMCKKLDLALIAYLKAFLIISILELTTYAVFRLQEKLKQKDGRTKTLNVADLKLIRSGLKIWVLVLSWNGLLQFERFVLGAALTPSEFGTIWSISTLAAAVMLVSAPLNSFALPKLNRVSSDDLIREFMKLVRTYTLLIFCPAVFGLIYHKEIFAFWLGIQITLQDSLIFSFYLVGNLVHILAGFAYFIRYRTGISRRFLYATLVFTLTQGVAIYVFAQIFGALGTSIVWLIFALLSLSIFAIPKIETEIGITSQMFRIVLTQVSTFGVFLIFWKTFSEVLFLSFQLKLFSGVVGLMFFMFGIARGKKDEYV